MPELLQTYVTRSAECSPDAVALVLHGDRVTYSQLENITNQLARLLRDAGCRQGDRVCFLVPKSPLAIICLVAILKADCIHVPLDGLSPAPRIARIIQSCEPRLLLAAGPWGKLLEELSATDVLRHVGIGWVGPEPAPSGVATKFAFGDVGGYSIAPLDYKNQSQSASHILFTSGSTGIPKGVVITHSNVLNFVEWAKHYFQLASTDRISGHPPLHFDLSQFDIFGAFAVGAELCLVPPELNLLPHKMVDFIRTLALTQWFSVPSLLHYIAKFDGLKCGDFPYLRRILWCGETLATPVLIHWMERLPHVTFTNLYGPTESTIASSYYTVPKCPDDENAPIPIGRPCEGEDLLVLDENLNRVPPGQIGDLFIRGVGLSPGYWRDTEKTASVFLPNPYGNGSDRIYKTGDLARVGEDGLVYFLGRADSQIKCRGYRIELGEIETGLNTIELVRECAVVAIPSEDFEGTTICCAYSSRQEGISPATLRSRLSQIVPNYMMPSRWLALDELPKNSNGKIDRPNLREQFRTMSAPADRFTSAVSVDAAISK
jgi:amino acid adenylation domain-containing protein